MLRTAIRALTLLAATQGLALELELPPGARQTASRDSALAQVAVPVAPFGDQGLETATFEGPVQRSTYRVPSQALTPLQLLAPLREQVQAAGYEVILDCDQDSCGGFDFRFAIEVLPAPNMYVNIRAYHFVTARSADGAAAVMLLASAAQSAGYLQIIAAGETAEARPVPLTGDRVVDTPAPPPTDFVERLLRTGSAVMTSIEFAVGTTTLSDIPSPEMTDLAALMEERPNLQIAVVGHTDTVGGLDANISVSRARAAAVRTRLTQTYGVDPARVEAAGMGYLAPRASNLTEEGREQNRRVEVIVVRDGT
ncbi:OmpA family protein [uncultured Tateyamaria sp.]|uniref:OmpA family protein n=1 Tax=Tateyamaria sp. 1078 TaxID=3417464 RepID=UPI00260754F4|nr:OmpA family protein [uncultured Tateyamaria sp.]